MKRTGIAPIVIILILAAVVLAGGGGYYVWKSSLRTLDDFDDTPPHSSYPSSSYGYSNFGKPCTLDSECICTGRKGVFDECGKPGQYPACVNGKCGFASVSPGEADVNSVFVEVHRLGIQITGKASESLQTFPQNFDNPQWGPVSAACKRGGYDLSAYAGKNVVLKSFPTDELYMNKSPLDVVVIMSNNEVVCVYKVAREGKSGIPPPVPGIFPVERPEDSLPNTSSWKIYRNEKYGFEVKYPPEWIASQSDVVKLEITNADLGARLWVSIFDFRPPSMATFQDQVNERPYTLIKFQGRDALRNFQEGPTTPGADPYYATEGYLIPSATKDWAVGIGMVIKDTRTCTDCVGLFEQIASTLKFISQ